MEEPIYSQNKRCLQHHKSSSTKLQAKVITVEIFMNNFSHTLLVMWVGMQLKERTFVETVPHSVYSN